MRFIAPRFSNNDMSVGVRKSKLLGSVLVAEVVHLDLDPRSKAAWREESFCALLLAGIEMLQP
jgi:hypothetical protein